MTSKICRTDLQNTKHCSTHVLLATLFGEAILNTLYKYGNQFIPD